MKRKNKLVAVILVAVLLIPMLLSGNTAAAAKKKEAGKVTAESVMKKCVKASGDVHSLYIDLDFKLEVEKLGKMKLNARGTVQDGPVAADLDIYVDMSDMKAMFDMSGNNGLTEDDLKVDVKAYAETTEEGFYAYEFVDGLWSKIKVADSSDTYNVMGLDTTDIQKAFLKNCKVKETKKAYVLTSDVKITNKMVKQVLDAAQGTAGQFEEEDVNTVKKMFGGSKAIKFSMTIDKKTYRIIAMDGDATAFVNSVLENAAKIDDRMKIADALVNIKDCSFTMKLGKFNEADRIIVPEDAKKAAEQNAREAVNQAVDKAKNSDAADSEDEKSKDDVDGE